MFIKVHSIDRKNPTYMNVDNIRYFEPYNYSENGERKAYTYTENDKEKQTTLIYLGYGNMIVKETPEEIYAMTKGE